LVADMVNIEVVAAPGTLFQYNNQNFALAGWLIEHVTGQTWEDYVRQYIFSPLDMPTANFDIADMQATGNYASPHSLSILEGMQPIPFFDGLAPIGPSGSINANSIEMANYVAFQLGDGTFNGQEIVSQALLDEMHTQQIEGYGLGWVIQEHAGLDIVWHNGSIDGFSSNLVLVPE